MHDTLNTVLLDLLYVFLIGVIPVLIQAVKVLAKHVTAYYNSKTKNEQLKSVLDTITKFTTEAVTYTMQTYVDSVKNDGKFNKESQAIAFDKAMSSAKEFISDEYKELFESVYGNLEDYLAILIEAKVKELKLQTKALETSEN